MHKQLAMDTCVKKFAGAILKVVEGSTNKSLPPRDPKHLIMTGIQGWDTPENQAAKAVTLPGTPL